MNVQALINLATLAISLFNMILSLWLGLTVLFNAERRSWGVFLAVSGLLASAIFFFGHSLILALGAPALIKEIRFWWHVAWVPLVVAPCLWYLLMLWYGGYWDDRQGSLHRRQKGWLLASLVYTFLIIGVLILANPLPGFSAEKSTIPDASIGIELLPAFSNIPFILLIFPLYIVLVIGLSLDALFHPAPSGRVMGDQARRRARPWLIAASLVLFTVTLVVSGTMFWSLQTTLLYSSLADLIHTLSTTFGFLDLGLTVLLMAVLLLSGQAIISYEIFTGKTLPRRGFQRQWRNIVFLTSMLSGLSALGITAQIPTPYVIIGILALVTVSYALFGWQSFAERERSFQQLRPFASSQHLFDTLLKPSPASQSEIILSTPFEALCRDVLGTRRAALVPLGVMAALGSTPLIYPAGSNLKLPSLADLLPQFTSPHLPGIPVDPNRYDGAIWVAPLWSERGLIGCLFLGEKAGGGFYSLEEVEIARASGERLVDIQAIAEMAHHLAILQRQRLAASKILDQQTRRILHDEVLPALHAALLELNLETREQPGKPEQVIATISSIHRQLSDLLRDLPRTTAPEVARLGLFGALQETITRELAGSFTSVTWNIPSEVEQAVRGISPLSAEVAFFAAREALRNAARHANPANSLNLTITATRLNGLEIVIEDNGIGPVELKSASTGQGLALHSTMMAVIGGSLAFESAPGLHTRVILRLPEEAIKWAQ